jgi:hypothetical protein
MRVYTRGPYRRTRTLEQRFMAFVSPEPQSGCWRWMGSLDQKGYGQIRIDGSNVRATRVALTLAGRPKTDGLYVCHTCDVTACVNPDHLFEGSQAQNLKDASAKGRIKVPGFYGERCGSSKLTVEDAFYIRTSSATAGALALLFDVHRDTILGVKSGKNWTKALADLFAPLAAD